ncbi:MAG: hypothetical protein ACE15D_01525 [Candidatus Eisenbacteria bacterium]
MLLLVDTDAFCKLGIAGLLGDVPGLFDLGFTDCRRLPALLYMLRRGRLPKLYGAEACEALLSAVERVAGLSPPSDAWLDRLAHIPAIDPGEALLFASAAESGHLVLSGDKRALEAVKDVPGFAEALSGRIVVLEAALLGLCERHGAEVIRGRVAPLLASDMMVEVCFSPGNPDPPGALLSYFTALAREVAPLALWDPRPGGRA